MISYYLILQFKTVELKIFISRIKILIIILYTYYQSISYFKGYAKWIIIPPILHRILISYQDRNCVKRDSTNSSSIK